MFFLPNSVPSQFNSKRTLIKIKRCLEFCGSVDNKVLDCKKMKVTTHITKLRNQKCFKGLTTLYFIYFLQL